MSVTRQTTIGCLKRRVPLDDACKSDLCHDAHSSA
jgi:hypothetical protein